jgi:hypothetical protein
MLTACQHGMESDTSTAGESAAKTIFLPNGIRIPPVKMNCKLRKVVARLDWFGQYKYGIF